MITIAKTGERATVRLEFDVSPNIGTSELDAIHMTVGGMFQVLEHGARDKRYDGAFIKQGYAVQIQHAHKHLRHRGRPDLQSGLDQILHAITRLALAFHLTRRQRPSERAAG